MGFILFFSWWYGAGWVNSFKSITSRTKALASFLSFGILLRTLFEPWKQITLNTGPGTPLEVKFRVFLDNLFARAFGFVIRSMVLIFGSFATIATAIFGTLVAFTWPLIPLLPFIFIIAGLRVIAS